MTEYQITSWRQIPSLAIDADAYVAGWARSGWLAGEGTPDQVAHAISESIISEFSELRLAEILDSLQSGNSK